MIKLSSNGEQQWKIIRHMKSFGTTGVDAALEHGYPKNYGSEIDNLSDIELESIFANLDSKYGDIMTKKKNESKFVALLNRQGFFENKKTYKNLTSFMIGDTVKFQNQIGKIISIRESFVVIRDSNGHIEVFHDNMLEHCGHCHEEEKNDKESKETKEKPIDPEPDDQEEKEENMITELDEEYKMVRKNGMIYVIDSRGNCKERFQDTPRNVVMVSDYLRNRNNLSETDHPGFNAVQDKISRKQGVSKEKAGAILAASSRNASPAAKKANPRLKKV